MRWYNNMVPREWQNLSFREHEHQQLVLEEPVWKRICSGLIYLKPVSPFDSDWLPDFLLISRGRQYMLTRGALFLRTSGFSEVVIEDLIESYTLNWLKSVDPNQRHTPFFHFYCRIFSPKLYDEEFLRGSTFWSTLYIINLFTRQESRVGITVALVDSSWNVLDCFIPLEESNTVSSYSVPISIMC